MMRSIVAVSAALLLGACATTEQQAAGEQQQVAKADQTAAATTSSGDTDMSETVCRKEQTTGTRFANRVCKTRQEWEDEAKAVKNDPLASATRRSLQTNREPN